MSVKICGSADFELKATTRSAVASSGTDICVYLAGHYNSVFNKNISQISVTLKDMRPDHRDKKKTVLPVYSLRERSVCDPEFSMGKLVDSGQINPLSETTKKGSSSLSDSRLLIKVGSGYVNMMNMLSAIESLRQSGKESEVLQPWKRNSHGNSEAISPCL